VFANVNQELDELANYIRQTLPQSKAISNLSIETKSGAVSFAWNSRKFFVKPTLEVIELRGNGLFITGTSMLMQAVLARHQKEIKVSHAVEETIRQIEDLVSNHQTEKGLSLLEMVKQTIIKLTGPGEKKGLNFSRNTARSTQFFAPQLRSNISAGETPALG
jgi:hypothetical protein